MEWLLLLLGAVRALLRGRRDLVLENLLLRRQLAVLLRTRPHPRLRRRDKAFWVLVRCVWSDWRRYLVLVQPEAVIRWHRQGWRLFWWWRSRRPAGRSRLRTDFRALIARMSRENPLWGTERIRGELLKLKMVVSACSIRRYRWRRPVRPSSQTWRTFLANHASTIWAADLFTVSTLTFRTLYVLFFITHERRELVHFRVTAHPTAAWVWQQLINATPWGQQPKYLLRDRDRVYGAGFVRRDKALGVETLLTPFRAPRANAIAERVVRTVRSECLDHLIILNDTHLHTVLTEFVDYYNVERPHRSLGLTPPRPTSRSPSLVGPVRARPVLGGLHHTYDRAA
jgi:transposase InsO family protein